MIAVCMIAVIPAEAGIQVGIRRERFVHPMVSERRSFNETIEAADGCVLSVASFVETSMIVESRYGPDGIRALPN